MNEKKLTDEELIHALEEFERDIDINETGIYTKILDLIRRLQYGYSSASKASEEWKAKYEKERKENAEYEQKLYDGELDIESYARSWEEGDNRTVTCDLLNAMEQAVAVFNKQKKEIERLTEENEHLDMVAKQALADYQNAQVQVDELKNYAERLFEENQDHYDKLQNANLYIEKHEPIWKRNTEQAVKDTAKEIYENATEGFVFTFTAESGSYRNGYDKAIDDYDDKLKDFIKERYGVEVE